MLAGLLESAGLEALVEDAALSALNPLLQSAVGGAKVLVPVGDEARAREIVSASGVFPGAGDSDAEPGEEEWSAGAVGAEPEPEAPAAPGAEALSLRAVGAALVGFLFCMTVVAPLYALWLAVRAARARGARTRVGGRVAFAVAVDVAALMLAGALWASVLAPPEAPEPQPFPPAERRPRRPFP